MNRRTFFQLLWGAVFALFLRAPRFDLEPEPEEETPDRIERIEIRTDPDNPGGDGRNGFIVRSFYEPSRWNPGGTMIVVTHHDAEVLVSDYVSGRRPVRRFFERWLNRWKRREDPRGAIRC